MTRPVIICEDSPSLARVLCRKVGVWTSSRPMKLTAGDPDLVRRWAIAAIREHRPRLVVTDGLEGSAHEIAEACASMGVHCIVFTGDPDRYAWCEAAVISKPEWGELEAAVRGALALEAA